MKKEKKTDKNRFTYSSDKGLRVVSAGDKSNKEKNDKPKDA